jgi:hypothetical protein
VPMHDHADVKQGWRDYYWKPLRAWLAATPRHPTRQRE